MKNLSHTWLHGICRAATEFFSAVGGKPQGPPRKRSAAPARADNALVVYDNVMALSIRQPWAWLIVEGYKDVENRTWGTKYRGPLLIHAGKALTEDYKLLRRSLIRAGYPLPEKFDRGGIVGAVELVDVITKARDRDDEWFEGSYGFILQNAQPLPFFPMKGKLGLFRASYNIESTLGVEEA